MHFYVRGCSNICCYILYWFVKRNCSNILTDNRVLFSDVELKCLCIKTSSGKIIYNISAEIKDEILSRFKELLRPYGDVINATKGSLVIHIRFYSIVKLTTFWLAYLDGSLANQMLDVFLTKEISASHDPSSLHLDLEFGLNSYVDAAYQLNMHMMTTG